MKYVYLLCAMLFYSSVSLASVVESCPRAETVTLRNGIYTAPANASAAEWIAVASAPTASPLKTFEAAVFYPANNEAGSTGRIGYCEYRAADRSLLNLHYNNPDASGDAMTLVEAGNWKMYTSGFGLAFYECNSSDTNGCSFSVRN
ncbi:DUF3757 domain-containing protein [uncultured Pseudomonas sp.]|uniref:DUF3757 domain-containing protein n=1 Tax=uncultured Pseudomonas sp. TaxID=114707 RepID=UPI0027DAFD0D|nr:DUF3757 domain-containing protein [uncultured Pseudomonas sp.]